MPLGDVETIGSSATFFTCIYARLFLKEKLVLSQFINIGVVIAGLILIVQVKSLMANQYILLSYIQTKFISVNYY